MNKAAAGGITIILLISIILGSFIPRLQFNYVFEEFFPTDDPELEIYRAFQERFEEDNNYILIGLKSHPTIFDSTFLSRTGKLIKKLRTFESTENVNSITELTTPIITPAGLINIPVLHPEDPARYRGDSIRIFKSDWIPGNLLAEDASSMIVSVYHKPFYGKDNADKFLNEIKSALDESQLTDYHLAGKVYAQHVYVEKMKDELILFVSLSVLLVIGFLALIYRSLWAILVPLVVVGLSVVWLAGLMALTNKSLDLLMVLMPTILFVVGMSDVVHILSRYLEELRKGYSKIQSIKTTLREIGLATFLTSITTSVGFITLMTSSIEPVREFGLYIAIGVFFAFIIAFTLLPAILYFLKQPEISHKTHLKKKWNRYLGTLFLWVINHKKWVLTVTTVLLIISVIGISRININTYLIEDLPADDPLKQDFTFFDENYGGSRPLEATVTLVDTTSSLFDKEVIEEIEKVEQIIASSLPTSFLISPVFIVKGLNQAVHGGNQDYFIVPDEEAEWRKINKYLQKANRRNELKNIISSDGQQARISGRMDDIGSNTSLAKRDEIVKRIDASIDKNIIKTQITGSSFLIDKNNEYLVTNMLYGLSIAFGVVAIIAGLMFMQWRMVFITLIPNILPLLITAGIMGYFDISMKLSTSMVFTIAFGIAVDDTIHFISKLRLEIAKGKSLLYAIKRSFLSTGKAITITTVILSGGFLILLFSSFGGTFYTGLLVGLTLILALIIDLVLLPVLIILVYPTKLIKKA